jgi:hypothetical protein
VPASIANLLAENDPVFAEEVVLGALLVTFDNLRQFAGWVLTAKCFSVKRFPHELRNCLPKSMRNQSVRDPVNKSLDDVLLRVKQHLIYV